MLDAITLDQLRTFLAVVDEGSFSAAGRKVRRVQSAVSHAMGALETQLGVTLWDRGTRVPTLTDEGRVLLAAARRVCADADELRRIARGLVEGLEPTIGLALDAVYPTQALVDLCREFAATFPTIELRVFTETMSAVAELVRDGSCQLGVVGEAADTQGLERLHVTSVRMVPIAAKTHPLAKIRGRISAARLEEHVQIVLSERGPKRAPDQGVLSPRTWRVADLSTKHELLRAGLGWGNLPEHMVRDEIARGRLVKIRPAAWDDEGLALDLAVVHRRDTAFGPATRWMLHRITELCVRHTKPAPTRKPRRANERLYDRR